MRLYNSRVAPKSNRSCVLRRRDETREDTQAGAAWGDGSIALGQPRSAGKQQRLGQEQGRDAPLRASWGKAAPLIHWLEDLLPPKLKNKFLLLHATKSVVIGASGPGKLYPHPQAAELLILRTVLRDKQKGHDKAKCVMGLLSNTQARLQRKWKWVQVSIEPFIIYSHKLALPNWEMTCGWQNRSFFLVWHLMALQGHYRERLPTISLVLY